MWAVRPDAPELKALLDDFIAGHRRGTLIGNVLFKRYYKNDLGVENTGAVLEGLLGIYHSLKRVSAHRRYISSRTIGFGDNTATSASKAPL